MAYDENNIFAKILREEIPSYRVYENGYCVAIMDAMPQSDGHTLVMPRAAAENLFDLDADIGATVFETVQHVAKGVRAAFKPDGIRLMQFNGAPAGQSVFHFHMHIVPVYADRPNLAHGNEPADSATLEKHAEMIRQALQKLKVFGDNF